MTRVPWASPDVLTNSLKWTAEARLMSEWRGDERVVEVRYEELARAPERQLRALCRRLGVAFEAAMLRPQHDEAARDTDSEPWKMRVHQRVSDASVSSWRERIGDARGHLIQRVCAREMDELGYEAAPIGLRYRCLLPVTAARELALWLRHKRERGRETGDAGSRAGGTMGDAVRLLFAGKRRSRRVRSLV